MFSDMMAGIREEAVQFLFNVEVRTTVAEPKAQPAPAGLTYTAPSEQGAPQQQSEVRRPPQQPNKGGQGSSFFKN
jgi:preprotein translocase subunit SecA